MTQKSLDQFDRDLAQKCQEYEDRLFDRESRRAMLKSFDPPAPSIIASLIEAAKKRDEKLARQNKVRKWFQKSESWLREKVCH